jgi:hypothetical protein
MSCPNRAADCARRTASVADHQLDVGTTAHVAHNTDVFQTNQGGEDLSGVDEDEVLLGRWFTPRPWSTFA